MINNTWTGGGTDHSPEWKLRKFPENLCAFFHQSQRPRQTHMTLKYYTRGTYEIFQRANMYFWIGPRLQYLCDMDVLGSFLAGVSFFVRFPLRGGGVVCGIGRVLIDLCGVVNYWKVVNPECHVGALYYAVVVWLYKFRGEMSVFILRFEYVSNFAFSELIELCLLKCKYFDCFQSNKIEKIQLFDRKKIIF